MRLPSVLLAALTFAFYTPAGATIRVVDTIEQPVNLGAYSDPSAIPLGPVPMESNHGFHRHSVIDKPRPVQHGAMEWREGSMLDQNLAHVFGIAIDTEDLFANMDPVTLRVKAWPVPSYSPYTREQVLAATLHCLLRSCPSTPKNPIRIKITTDNPADHSWAGKFAGSYFTQPDQGGPPIEPTPVPGGGRVETDRFGVARVIFSDAKTTEPSPAPPPIFVPFHIQGESDGGQFWALLPVWVGDTFKKPLDALGQPYKLYYNLFDPTTSATEDGNGLFESSSSIRWSIDEDVKGTSASLSFGKLNPENLAAFLQAVVFSVRPTAEKPLTITLTSQSENPAYFQACLDAGGWKRTKQKSEDSLVGTFVLDPVTNKLLQGNIPGITIVQGTERPMRLTRVITE